MTRFPSLRRLGVLTGLAALLLTFGRPVQARVFEPETFTLDNGLQVVVVTNRRAPIVNHMVWYKVGAADEEPGKSGLAHFVEHLLFKGTETAEPGEFSDVIARNGGRENAFTSYDYTGYFQTIASDRLALMMRYEADRMANLVLTDEVVLPERDVILEERRSRVDNEPGAQLSEMARAALFMNHPYGISIIGWEHEMRQLTTEDALAFYRRWYAPNNAVVVISGDVTLDEVRPLAEKYYGAVPRRAVPERLRPQEPVQMAPRRVVLQSPRVRQPAISISYLAPSYNRGEPGEAYALQVLSEILGGGSVSRLYLSLVVEQGLAAAAGSGYGGDDLDLSTFTFYGSPRPGTDLDLVEAALRAEIDKLLKDGVTEAEVAEAKERLQSAAVFARDNVSTPSRVLGAALVTGQTIEDVEAWPARIGAVTAEQVNAVARAVFDARRSVTSVLEPEPTS
ncbi:MAG: insulinase family protein [Kiloniellales bacterium]|nr:insulinase family protein [Kiloniellales bacterium]